MRSRFCSTFTSILLALVSFTAVPHTTIAISLTPADHLMPPPLPQPQRLVHAKAPNYSAAFTPPAIPLKAPVSNAANESESGFMTRIARWFGFGPHNGAIREQQLAAATHIESYYYPKPNHQGQTAKQNDKAGCNLCNKYPWVPMFQHGVPYAQTAEQQQQNWAQSPPNLDTQASQNYFQTQALATSLQHQQVPVKQRAVQFNFPTHPNAYQQQHQGKYIAPPAFIPIPVPNLSASVLPPLYNAQPFRPSATSSRTTSLTEQQLPSTEPAQFVENIGAHSELQPDHVFPTQIPPTTVAAATTFPNLKDASIEIIKSHQLTDFVSSVEYPATYVQSESIDLGSQQMPANHKPATENVNTVRYQHEIFKPNLNKHIPASQILTELGNFGTALQQEQQQQEQQETNLHTQLHEQGTNSYNYQNEVNTAAVDNFPSASSHNLTQVLHQQQPNNLDNWLENTAEFYYTTTAAPLVTTTLTTGLDFNTENGRQTTVELVPSLQTNFIYQQQHELRKQPSSLPEPPQQLYYERNRETPKRLLDAPILHDNGLRLPPQPFTRDPSNLDFRLGAPQEFVNHAYADLQQKQQQQPLQHSTILTLVTALPPLTVSAAAPTPTSTYSALDASGQYAGMSPPAPPPPPAVPSTNNVHQIIVPYTTKNRPRPFEPKRHQTDTTTPLKGIFDRWTSSGFHHEQELHEQQESKLVSSATEAPPANTRRTTKYLTKILASNLRELLRREHELNNKSSSNQSNFDLRKLQKNIDDWTEQEYTSLSHRPSTPTIRGRSKHIPSEYLTTTPPPASRLPKTTKAFDFSAIDLSTSINNLEPLLLDRGSNHLYDFYETDATRRRSSTTTTTTTSAPSTTASTASIESTTAPYYIHAVPTQASTELWQKAKVSISPQTMERVYVVTPQPRFFPQRNVLVSTSTERPSSLDDKSNFKSPRFLVRPTPGNGTSNVASDSATSSSFYTPELFGLMGLSAFVPAEPVEIIDGNSKVITALTPTPPPQPQKRVDIAKTKKQLKVESSNGELQQRSHIKSTMSPSPR